MESVTCTKVGRIQSTKQTTRGYITICSICNCISNKTKCPIHRCRCISLCKGNGWEIICGTGYIYNLTSTNGSTRVVVNPNDIILAEFNFDFIISICQCIRVCIIEKNTFIGRWFIRVCIGFRTFNKINIVNINRIQN